MNMRLKILASVAGLSLVLGLSGCATSKIDAQWSDTSFAGQPLSGAKVLVVCQAAEQTVVRICQDQLATQLRNVGITPVMSDALNGGSEKIANEKTVAAARGLGARAVMLATLNPTTTVSSSGPSVGFGFGSGGYHSGVGLGMSLPVGSQTQTTSTSYASDTTLTSVENGKLIWSGKASTLASQEVAEQIAGLAKVSVEAARKAGVL